MKKWVCLTAMLFLATMPAVGWAASSWAEEGSYFEKVEAKLAFALTNIMLGWTDLIAEPEQAAEDGTSMWAAAGKGVSDFFLNTVGGILHLATFPITAIDIPLPDGGVAA